MKERFESIRDQKIYQYDQTPGSYWLAGIFKDFGNQLGVSIYLISRFYQEKRKLFGRGLFIFSHLFAGPRKELKKYSLNVGYENVIAHLFMEWLDQFRMPFLKSSILMLNRILKPLLFKSLREKSKFIA